VTTNGPDRDRSGPFVCRGRHEGGIETAEHRLDSPVAGHNCRVSETAALMGDQLPTPLDTGDAQHLLWAQFTAQFTDYSRAARTNRLAYQSSKVITIVVAAAVTICAALSAPAWLTASLGGVLVVVEGLQQMFQWQTNWITYRRAAEQMRQHGFAFAAAMPPYGGADRRERLAAEMQTVALTENTTWAGRMREPEARA
jgi:hypothetical protein